MKHYICFDVGGTNVKFALMNANGDIVSAGKYPTCCSHLDIFVDSMLEVVKNFQHQENIEGIGISLPGFIDPKTGYSELAGAITALNGKNLRLILQEKVNLPIAIENDANCAALAEKFNGNAVECDDFICMTIGTGIGGGIFVNGKLVHGYRFKAGEFGFMITEGVQNGYQNMHSLSSTSSLIKEYKKYKNIHEETMIEGNIIFEEMKNDDQLAKIVEGWVDRLSHGIFNLASVLNPEKILIGGGISEREDLYLMLKTSLEKIPVWADIEVAIQPCKHRNHAGLVGALYNLRNKIKE